MTGPCVGDVTVPEKDAEFVGDVTVGVVTGLKCRRCDASPYKFVECVRKSVWYGTN